MYLMKMENLFVSFYNYYFKKHSNGHIIYHNIVTQLILSIKGCLFTICKDNLLLIILLNNIILLYI